jgi:hypothetical protein
MDYRLFFDESCHLVNNDSKVMTVGYIKVPEQEYSKLHNEFKSIMANHRAFDELKWNKFAKSRVNLYKRIIDFFFEKNINFRCVVIKHKDRLGPEDLNKGSYDNFYYKMVVDLLDMNSTESTIKVFLDVKDTRGKEKLNKINEAYKLQHHGNSPFKHFQHLHSHDSVFIQLADFLIGAITYKSRTVRDEFKMEENRASIIYYLEEKAGYYLEEGTPHWEDKFHISDYQPKRK